MGHQLIAESRWESRRKSRRKSRRVRRKEIRRISVKIVVGQIVNRRERRLLEVSARKSRKLDAQIRQISYAVADADADVDGVNCGLDVALWSVAKDVPLHRRRRKKTFQGGIQNSVSFVLIESHTIKVQTNVVISGRIQIKILKIILQSFPFLGQLKYKNLKKKVQSLSRQGTRSKILFARNS